MSADFFDEGKFTDRKRRKGKKKGKKKLVEQNEEQVQPTKKRVNFSWLNHGNARRAKAYMAYIGDRKKKRYMQIGKKRAYFDECVLPRVLKKFPSLFEKISTYYHDRGRQLDREGYAELLYARFINMYDTSMQPNHEHPINSSNKRLKQDYLKFKIKKS